MGPLEHATNSTRYGGEVGHDLVIRGGTVVDGTGAPARVADVAVDAGRITAVGPLPPTATGHDEMDAAGLLVTPGWIDLHTHYDAQLLWDPLLGSSVQYGVTTVVIGNCGFGVAPVRPGEHAYLIQLLARVEGMPVAALEAGLPWDWTSYAEYLDRIDTATGPNIMALVGHSALRHSVMGADAYRRPAAPAEIAAMQDGLDSALTAGAWGFSSSMAATHNDMAGRPAPSRLAEMAELEALADVVARFPFGVIGVSPASKLRGLTDDDRDLLTMLSVRGHASVNWNPLLYTSSIPDLWRVNLDATAQAGAATAGGRVFAVFNPSSTGGNRVDLDSLFLFEALPHWKPIAGRSRAEKVAAFSDPATRAHLAADLDDDVSGGFLTAKLRTMWDILRITQVFSAENTPVLGRLVGDIAREHHRAPLDVMLDIAIVDELRTVFMQEDVRTETPAARNAYEAMVASPHVLFGGSDAGAHLDMLTNESLPARTLEWRVRDQGTLPLEEAVRGFSADIADALGLAGRGRLVEGMAADIVVLDLDAIGAGDARVAADLPGGAERLVTDARGVRATVVNGAVVYDSGKPTGALTGRLLRSSAPENRATPVPPAPMGGRVSSTPTPTTT